MADPFANNVPLNPQQVNRFANKANINARGFNLTSGQVVVLDMASYIGNKLIQVNTFSGSLSVEISCDGINFFAGPAIAATGMYIVPLPCKFVQLTSGGNCSGLVVGSLSGNASSGSGGGGGGGITDLTGDVSATGPGITFATVNSVGGVSAANVASGANSANAATSADTPSTIVKRDASGNFSATTISANLTGNVTGNVSGSSASFTGSLAGDVTGTQSATAISATTVSGKLLTGYVVGANTPIAATDSILSAFEKIQGQINNTDLSAITALTGDVTASGPGSAASTIHSVGGSTAANVHSAELLANAATNLDTVSTIVKRDSSGNFSATMITSNLTGNVTGNVSGTSANVTGVVAIANGGTSQTTAAAARGPSGLNIDERTTFSNANYIGVATDRYIAQIGTMSAPRTVTLPAASSVNAGQILRIQDESGTVSTTNTITIQAAGSDLINGTATKTIRSAYGDAYLTSNGSNAWTRPVTGIGAGGTGLNSIPTNGQILIGNSTTSAYNLANLLPALV